MYHGLSPWYYYGEDPCGMGQEAYRAAKRVCQYRDAGFFQVFQPDIGHSHAILNIKI